MAVKTNLRVLQKSRLPPEQGEVFVMQLPNENYLFGRVVCADAARDRAPMPGANLIYIFGRQYSAVNPVSADLRPINLLIPPLWTNNLPWSKGYFKKVETRALEPFDVLRQHCFVRAAASPHGSKRFVDERGGELSRRS